MPDPLSVRREGAAPVVVHLIRHGLVENPGGLLYGRLPGFHLSAPGAAMAKRIAEYLGGSDITYLAASSLERAAETAAPLASALGLDVVTDDRLIEPTNVFEGTRFSVGDGVLRRPEHWAKVRDPFTPSWGEPYLDVAHRMLAAVYTAVTNSAGQQAALVSHQLPIWTLRRYLEGKRLWHNPSRRQCGLASVTSLRFADGVFQGLRYREPAADLIPAKHAGAVGA